MIRVSQALKDAIRQASRHGGAPSSIYLTRTDTEALLEEMNQRRDRRFTRAGQIDRFDNVPVYCDRPVSMLVYHNQAGDASHVLV